MYKSDETILSLLSEVPSDYSFDVEEQSFNLSEIDFSSFVNLPCPTENLITKEQATMEKFVKTQNQKAVFPPLETIQLADLLDFEQKTGKHDLDTPPVIFSKDNLLDSSIENSYNLKDILSNDAFFSNPSMHRVEKVPEVKRQVLIVEPLVQEQSFAPSGEELYCVKSEAGYGDLYQQASVESCQEVERSPSSVLPIAVEDETVAEEQVETTDFGTTIITISQEELRALTGYFEQQSAGIPTTISETEASLVPSITPPVLASQPRLSPAKGRPQSGRNSFKAPSAASRSSKSAKLKRLADLDKDSEEYREKRDRNNESVRKSRDKARQRQEETEGRLELLSDENRRLQDKVDSLEKELSILRGLFSNVGESLPKEVEAYQVGNRRR